MKITTILALTVWIFLSSCGSAYAQENDIGISLIHPASPFYFLKAIRENLELKFALTSRVKFFRHLEFATRRLRETKALIPGNEDLIPPTLEKYSSHLKTLPDKDLEDKETQIRIKESLVVHLETLQKIYDQVSNRRAKMAIRASLNRIIQRKDLPDYAILPVCSLFAKEASSSALNQTEKVVYLERSQKCFESLGTNNSR